MGIVASKWSNTRFQIYSITLREHLVAEPQLSFSPSRAHMLLWSQLFKCELLGFSSVRDQLIECISRNIVVLELRKWLFFAEILCLKTRVRVICCSHSCAFTLWVWMKFCASMTSNVIFSFFHVSFWIPKNIGFQIKKIWACVHIGNTSHVAKYRGKTSCVIFTYSPHFADF